jgi:hypothetical protein
VGEGLFASTDGNGNVPTIKQYTDWDRDWVLIVPGNFGGDGHTDLLFYKRSVGQGLFVSTDGSGNVTTIKQFNDWDRDWNVIIPGNFGGDGHTDLLFYKRSGGIGLFAATDGSGNVPTIKQYTDWDRTWRLITPGDFGGNGFTDLVFYGPPKPPKAPTRLHVTRIATGEIDVAWTDNSNDEDGFRVHFQGKKADQSDHTGTKAVGPNVAGAVLGGLRSGYDYQINVLAFNAAGNSPPSNTVEGTTPAPTISVSKQGVGASTVLVITGNGFTPGSLVVIRVTTPDLQGSEFVETAGGDGKFVSPHSFPCVSGRAFTVTAFEDADPQGTFANAVVTTCP